jgi:uncharacterized Zn finger protein
MPDVRATGSQWFRQQQDIKRGRVTKFDKAMRLLTTRQLLVTRVSGDFIEAECRGDSGSLYNLGFDGERWWCSCPARVDCKHLIALQTVTVRRNK